MLKSIIFFLFIAVSLQADHFHVCTVASHKTENLNKLLKSCEKNHIDLEIIGLGLPYYGNGTKLVRMAEYLSTLDDDHIVMFVDAFDVIIIAEKDKILEKFISMNTPILMSAEKNCFPSHLRSRYPPLDYPFRYLNSGGYIGYVGALKSWLADLPPINPQISDQLQITNHFLDGNVFFILDHQCDIFLSLYQVFDREVAIDAENGIVRCLTTDSEPCVIHANGKSFRIWEIIYKELVSE